MICDNGLELGFFLEGKWQKKQHRVLDDELKNLFYTSMNHWAKRFLLGFRKDGFALLNYRPECPEDADFCC